LALENQMVGPSMTQGLLVGANSRPHLAAPPAASLSLPVQTTSGKRSKKGSSFVDPCAIAPLKKRRIQVSGIIKSITQLPTTQN